MFELDVKVKLEGRGIHHYGRSIDTSKSSLERIRDNYRGCYIEGPISFFTARRKGRTSGIAYPGTACHTRDGNQININWVWELDPEETALTFAHELGHNIGMRHDFYPKHKSRCDGKGIMSYGDHPEVWSTCSNKDFANWYQNGLDSLAGYHCL